MSTKTLTKNIICKRNFIANYLATMYMRDLIKNVNYTSVLRRGDGAFRRLPRKIAHLSNKPWIYKYGDLSLMGSVWPKNVIEARDYIEEETAPHTFNAVLMNLFCDGNEGIGWHNNAEQCLGPHPIIANLILGASRNITFLNQYTGDKFKYRVNHGDLVILGPNFNEKYLMAFLKEDTKYPTINLMYRFEYLI